MNPITAEHPSTADLADFALGKLDAAGVERVQAHIAACIACRTIAEQTPADTLMNLLKRAGSPARTGTYTPTPSGQSPQVQTVPPAPADLPPALRDHPRYRILRLLGRGGMGVVYQAEHKVMERLVAVKVISRELVAKPEAMERFHREVRAAAKLDHPNIVKAYDAEQAGDLQLLAMEFVEGKSLADVLDKKGPLPIANACHYIRQAALGLQHAFERGMVHRDLKPQNLMLTPKGVVKILDFGLAKVASESARPGGGLTQENMVMGTPEYMAPEQAMNSKAADIRADIYALGATLYCLLTGRPPFTGDEPLAIIVAHAQDVPPPVESLRPGVPSALAALVGRMLAKDPAQRPQTPKEVANSLAPFTKPAAITPTIPQKLDAVGGSDPFAGLAARPARPATRPTARRGWLIPAIAAGLLLAVGGLVAGIVMWLKVPGGMVKLEVEPPDAKVEVVDGKITVSRPGDAEPWRIEMAGDKGQLKISKAGFVVQTRDVTLGEKGQTIRVELQPEKPPVPRPAKTADGFVPLFNGKDLTGWKTHDKQPGNWRVEKGILIGSGQDDSYLYTQRGDYKNYHLRAVARINEGGDSGVFFRSPFGPVWPTRDPSYPSGYEAQINSTYKDAKTGSLFVQNGPGSPPGISVKDMLVPAGQWFVMEVIAEDNHLVIKVDEKTTADHSDEKRTFVGGHIALQKNEHVGEQKNATQTVIEFRKIEIKELPPADDKGDIVPPPAPVPALTHKPGLVELEQVELHLKLLVYARSPDRNKTREHAVKETAAAIAAVEAEDSTAIIAEHLGMVLKDITALKAGATNPQNLEHFKDIEGGFVGALKTLNIRMTDLSPTPGDKATIAFLTDYADLAKGRWVALLPSAKEFDRLRNSNAYRNALPKYANGELECSNGWLLFPPLQAKDAIIRARVKRRPKADGNVALCLREGESDFVSAWFNGSGEFGIGRKRPGAYDNLATCKLADDYKGFFEFAFAAVGDKLTAYANGKRILEVRHDRLDVPGSIGVGGIRIGGLFRDIEVQVLDTPAPPANANDGFVSLFNGKDLTGWKTHPDDKAKWEVMGGAITASGPTGHLFSERNDFENFVFRIEAKINAVGNSGQYFRARFQKSFPDGYEAQINIGHIDPIKTGSLYPKFNPGLTAGQKQKIIIRKAPHAADEWFTQEVTAIGNHIIIRVNDVTTVDFVDETNAFTKGHLAIQHHDPTCKVMVRKAEVKELK